MEFVYIRALKSLREHKEPIRTGSDCKNLKFFGEKTCKRIDDSLRDYCRKNNVIIPELQNAIEPQNSTSSLSEINFQAQNTSSEVSITSPKKISRSNDVARSTKPNSRTYVPKYRSPGYGFMIALFKAERENAIREVSKNELMQLAQPYCDGDLLVKKDGSRGTTQSAINTLIKHGFVETIKRRYCSYSLTQKGRDLGHRLLAYEAGEALIGLDAIQEEKNGDDATEESEDQPKERFALVAGSYDIFLLIDSREQYSGSSSDLKKTAILTEFLNRNIACRMLKLPAGDFAWMALERIPTYGVRRELLLDYVIERKRYDDLASSIRTGRWHEQKYRLSHCGVRKPMYLIEDFGPHRRTESLYQGMVQAIADAQIIDKFIVKQTRNYQETINYLATMTRCLQKYYADVTLHSCSKAEIIKGDMPANYLMTVNEFSLNAEKITNFTCTEMFVKHLLKLRGISVAKAKSIVQYYPTLNSLLAGYETCESDMEKQLLLSEIQYGALNRKIGPNLSKKVYKYYLSS